MRKWPQIIYMLIIDKYESKSGNTKRKIILQYLLLFKHENEVHVINDKR